MGGEWWNVGLGCWLKNKEQEGSIDGFLFRPVLDPLLANSNLPRTQ